MCDDLQYFNQHDYARVLGNHGGRKLGYVDCIRILMDHGATYGQAENGAYTYLHHGEHIIAQRRGCQAEYNRILNGTNGHLMSNMECIKYLESMGFSQGQAKNASYKYRKLKGLI